MTSLQLPSETRKVFISANGLGFALVQVSQFSKSVVLNFFVQAQSYTKYSVVHGIRRVSPVGFSRNNSY